MDVRPQTTGDYAVSLLQRGYGVQSVASICGMHIDTVRPLASFRGHREEYTPPVKPKPRPVVIVAQSPREAQMAVVDAVARKYGRTADDLVSKRHTKAFAWARHEAMAAIRERFALSYPRIGALFGGRDHTTVLSAIRAYETRRAWCDVVMAMASAS